MIKNKKWKFDLVVSFTRTIFNFSIEFLKKHAKEKLTEGSSVPSIGKIKIVSIVFYLRNKQACSSYVCGILSYCAILSNSVFIAHALCLSVDVLVRFKSQFWLSLPSICACKSYSLVDQIPLELKLRVCC